MRPLYKHDCTSCIFLAHIALDEVRADGYVCPDKGTIVLREGNDGPEYNSYPVWLIGPTADPAGIWHVTEGEEFRAVNARSLVFAWLRDQAIARGHIKAEVAS